MNRRLKKYHHKHEYLKLEEQEVREELDEYIKDFEGRFNKYYQKPSVKEVWVNEETGEVRDDPPPFDDMFKDYEEGKRKAEESEQIRQQRLDDLKNRPDKLKKLYKKLASFAHPDRGGSNEIFQKLNEAYESNRLIDLLEMAGEHDLEYNVDKSDETILEKNLSSLEMEIHRMKSTIAWTWGRGDVNERKWVVKKIEKETGHKIDEKDLPDDLVDKPKETLLISTGSLED